ncbi:MAG: tetratricopeptide repeat protein [Litorimonas sp.]
MRIFLMTSVAVIIGLSSPAYAQSKKDLAAQNAALNERLTRLEQRMLTGDPAAERLMQRIDALESAQRSLRGELETISFERDNYKNELQALSADLRDMQAQSNRMKIHLDAVDLVAKETQAARNQSLNAGLNQSSSQSTYQNPNLSSVPAAPVFREQEFAPQSEINSNISTGTFGGSSATQAPANDLSELGQIGKTKLAEGDFSGAQTALSQYLEFNPDAPDVGEMQYWLGESYFVRGGYADAADAYIASMRTAPQGIKGPEAMVRLGASLRELGQTSAACQTLGSFAAQYPNAPVTVKEKAQLEAARTGC